MSEEQKPERGRPRIIPSPEEFDRRARVYFDVCMAEDEPVLLTGLVLALGLSSKQSLYEYKEYGEGFSDSVKKALTRVELEYERHLRNGGGAGAIFALKNFEWKDRQEMDLKHSVAPSVEIILNASEPAPKAE